MRKKVKLLEAKAFKFKLMNLNLASANITEVTELMEHGSSGGVEITTKIKVYFKVVEDRTATTLLEIIKFHVLPGSIVVVDGWLGYNGLTDMGYQHYTVNHSKEFVNHDTGFHTNHIEGTWSSLKSGLPSTDMEK